MNLWNGRFSDTLGKDSLYKGTSKFSPIKCIPSLSIMYPVSFLDVFIGCCFSARDLPATWLPTAWNVCPDICPASHNLSLILSFYRLSNNVYQSVYLWKYANSYQTWQRKRIDFQNFSWVNITWFLLSAVVMHLSNVFYFMPSF